MQIFLLIAVITTILYILIFSTIFGQKLKQLSSDVIENKRAYTYRMEKQRESLWRLQNPPRFEKGEIVNSTYREKEKMAFIVHSVSVREAGELSNRRWHWQYTIHNCTNNEIFTDVDQQYLIKITKNEGTI